MNDDITRSPSTNHHATINTAIAAFAAEAAGRFTVSPVFRLLVADQMCLWLQQLATAIPSVAGQIRTNASV
jgi:hypothetical protein